MQEKKRKRIKRWITILVILYVAIGAAFYFLHERFLFRPETLQADHRFNFTAPYKEINLAFNAEKNMSIVCFTVPDSVRKGVVLYFHGNKRNVERYAPFASHFTRNNYEVWMMDYPGFGKSTGKRTEDIMYDDAIQLYKMANAQFSRDSIIIYGKSLGTGVAAHLASIRDCKRLILETPYYSLDDVLRRYAFIYPVSWINKYHFPSYRYFPHIAAPVSIFHGTGDATIPYSHSKKLVKLAKAGAELITIENGGHNTLPDFPLFHRKLDSLLQLRK